MLDRIDPRTVVSAPSTPRAPQDQDARLRSLCREFEAIFIQEMFKAMRKTVPEDPLFGRDNGREIYQDLLDGELAREMARKQGLGLADAIYRQLRRLEGEAGPPERPDR